jgi:hypothetical protein
VTLHGFFLTLFLLGEEFRKNVYFVFLKPNFVISVLVIIQPPSKLKRERNLRDSINVGKGKGKTIPLQA